jgi:hypothetical protein
MAPLEEELGMSTQLAETRPHDAVLVEGPVPSADPVFAEECADNDHWLSAARGVVTAVLIATPFWMLVCVAIYMFA